MEDKDIELAVQNEEPEPRADAEQVQSTSTVPLRLSSLGKVNVIRDESFEVPGGKEHIVQYTVSDDQGITLRHSYNLTRIDGDGTYTTTSNFRIEEFSAGQTLQQQPSNTRTFQLTASGIKGEVIGDRRHDTVTTTMVAEDGTVQRQTQVVAVRLDLSEFAGLDTAALVTKMANIHLGKDQLSK